MYWPAQCSSDNCIVHDSTAKLEESTLLVAMAVKQHFESKEGSLSWKSDRN